MIYQLRLEKYQGPLEKLLELIEEKKLEVTEINLAEVTNDFLRYLRDLPPIESVGAEGKLAAEEYLRMLADFVAVASRLILIKSKSLLPDIPLTAEEQSDIKELEERLKLYQALKPAMKLIAKSWQSGGREFSRPYFLNAGPEKAGFRIFYPGSGLSKEALVSSLEKILEGLRKFALEEGTVKEEIVSVEEKIKEIIERIKNFGDLSFGKISGKGTRSEIIAAFLAILHLAYDQTVFLEQKAHFSDIVIKRRVGK